MNWRGFDSTMGGALALGLKLPRSILLRADRVIE